MHDRLVFTWPLANRSERPSDFILMLLSPSPFRATLETSLVQTDSVISLYLTPVQSLFLHLSVCLQEFMMIFLKKISFGTELLSPDLLL